MFSFSEREGMIPARGAGLQIIQKQMIWPAGQQWFWPEE
jgi:hypothetical protein